MNIGIFARLLFPFRLSSLLQTIGRAHEFMLMMPRCQDLLQKYSLLASRRIYKSILEIGLDQSQREDTTREILFRCVSLGSRSPFNSVCISFFLGGVHCLSGRVEKQTCSSLTIAMTRNEDLESPPTGAAKGSLQKPNMMGGGKRLFTPTRP